VTWIVERDDHGALMVGPPDYGETYCIVNRAGWRPYR
jgi:hypothetical protein